MPQSERKVVKLPRRTALKQGTLMESVYQEVLGRLQRGEVGADDRLLDYEIAEEFDCTRMPVRQALLRLVNEGYLVGTTRGFVVPTITETDIHEIFEVRRLLDPAAASGTVATLTDAQLAAMKNSYQMACRAYEMNDVEMMLAANAAFRDTWLAAVKNERLKSTIERFADHVQHVRLSTLNRPATQKIVVEGIGHLLEAFSARDSRRVKSLMIDFMKVAEQEYFAMLHSEK
ncbi:MULTISPECIES: GntR family transcriptional regulator [Paraburkholderia]|uniref:GntR family transcriptional regulator n=2 Tax=Burkholderiaceae TaxID=119060 RepID=UPI002112CBBD|nr:MULTISPECIES: GntR family transcriptional regulator [Paraburkholderia]MCP2084173.1 DNA-binding GntR family transcriptional regulator [Paraburkholderia sediminicola]MCX4138892.1 GntR family transcriptional regulator [Paraburkholderia aspalathi]MDN7171582.1 GntR family transcriptional regulator [Paraburkholderia sp. SEWSISQ10-3 4]MDQ6501221.1 GntR family transcriptional regulator [Paraburkholderia aspalathi]